MGFYDRDYSRDARHGMLGDLLPEGGVCKVLIVTLIAVFALQSLSAQGNFEGGSISQYLGLSFDDILRGEVWRLITFGFVHPAASFSYSSLLSLAFTLFFLWRFGSDLEQMYGSVEFLCYYLVAMLLGGLVFLAVSYLRGAPDSFLLGALGPITAVTVLYAWHFPNTTILVMMIVPVPIWLVVVLQMAGALYLQTEQAAYIFAGAVFGSLYYKKQPRFSTMFEGWSMSRRAQPRGRARLRVFDPEDDREPVAVAAPKLSAPLLDEHLEAKVDTVLEKMARSGKESLSEKEREILLQASEIYRRKRT